ncbi:MAG: hypothetical protein CENE_03793 [Candidatus Celerinatantimonas neptuna]|nr:MAG: hypothetical protein CENE_03793 [Candidatus Celerinatantimonas neptuna]
MSNRVRLRLSANLDGVPLVNELEEFTPPKIKPKMADQTGAFVASQVAVGLEKMDWTLKVKGELDQISNALGQYIVSNAQVNVTEQGKTTDDSQYKLAYSLYGPITGIEQDAVKMGEQPTCTISGTCNSFKQTDTGVVIHEINVKTGKLVVGGVDLMSASGISL